VDSRHGFGGIWEGTPYRKNYVTHRLLETPYIVLEDELQSGQAQLKNMSDSSQSVVVLSDLEAELKKKLG